MDINFAVQRRYRGAHTIHMAHTTGEIKIYQTIDEVSKRSLEKDIKPNDEVMEIFSPFVCTFLKPSKVSGGGQLQAANANQFTQFPFYRKLVAN